MGATVTFDDLLAEARRSPGSGGASDVPKPTNTAENPERLFGSLLKEARGEEDPMTGMALAHLPHVDTVQTHVPVTKMPFGETVQGEQINWKYPEQNIIRPVARGVLVKIPQLAIDAAEAMDPRVSREDLIDPKREDGYTRTRQAFERLGETPTLAPLSGEEKHPLRTEILESTATSITAPVLFALAGMPASLAAIPTVAAFAMAQYGEALARNTKQGLDATTARTEAAIEAVSEAGWEYISDRALLGPIGRFGKSKVAQKIADAVKSGKVDPLDKVAWKDYLKANLGTDFAKSFLMETGTEIANTGTQFGARKAFGIQEGINPDTGQPYTFLEQIERTAEVAGGQSGIYGVISAALGVKGANHARAVLADAKADPKERARVAHIAANTLAQKSEMAASIVREDWIQKISRGLPIDLEQRGVDATDPAGQIPSPGRLVRESVAANKEMAYNEVNPEATSFLAEPPPEDDEGRRQWVLDRLPQKDARGRDLDPDLVEIVPPDKLTKEQRQILGEFSNYGIETVFMTGTGEIAISGGAHTVFVPADVKPSVAREQVAHETGHALDEQGGLMPMTQATREEIARTVVPAKYGQHRTRLGYERQAAGLSQPTPETIFDELVAKTRGLGIAQMRGKTREQMRASLDKLVKAEAKKDPGRWARFTDALRSRAVKLGVPLVEIPEARRGTVAQWSRVADRIVEEAWAARQKYQGAVRKKLLQQLRNVPGVSEIRAKQAAGESTRGMGKDHIKDVTTPSQEFGKRQSEQRRAFAAGQQRPGAPPAFRRGEVVTHNQTGTEVRVVQMNKDGSVMVIQEDGLTANVPAASLTRTIGRAEGPSQRSRAGARPAPAAPPAAPAKTQARQDLEDRAAALGIQNPMIYTDYELAEKVRGVRNRSSKTETPAQKKKEPPAVPKKSKPEPTEEEIRAEELKSALAESGLRSLQGEIRRRGGIRVGEEVRRTHRHVALLDLKPAPGVFNNKSTNHVDDLASELGYETGDAMMEALRDELETGRPQYKFSLAAVTPEQDRAYMDAAENGDLKMAQRMVDGAAKRAGYGGVFFHGSPVDTIKTFRTHRSDSAFYFTNRKREATFFSGDGTFRGNAYNPKSKTARVYEVRLRIKRPLRVDVKGKLFDPDMMDEILHRAREGKNDGAIIKDIQNFEGGPLSTTVVVFDSNQIKSADPITRDDQGNIIPLSQRFNPKSDDIRFSLSSDRDKLSDVSRQKGPWGQQPAEKRPVSTPEGSGTLYFRLQPKGKSISGHYSRTSVGNKGPDTGLHVFQSPQEIFFTDADPKNYGNEVVVLRARVSWDNEDVEGVSIDPREARVVVRLSLDEFARRVVPGSKSFRDAVSLVEQGKASILDEFPEEPSPAGIPPGDVKYSLSSKDREQNLRALRRAIEPSWKQSWDHALFLTPDGTLLGAGSEAIHPNGPLGSTHYLFLKLNDLVDETVLSEEAAVNSVLHKTGAARVSVNDLRDHGFKDLLSVTWAVPLTEAQMSVVAVESRNHQEIRAEIVDSQGESLGYAAIDASASPSEVGREIRRLNSVLIERGMPVYSLSSDSPRWYSRLTKYAESLPGNQVKVDTLSAKLKSAPVDQDEIKWTGLADWIAEQKKAGRQSIPKSELLEYLSENAIRVEEKVLGNRKKVDLDTIAADRRLVLKEKYGIEVYLNVDPESEPIEFRLNGFTYSNHDAETTLNNLKDENFSYKEAHDILFLLGLVDSEFRDKTFRKNEATHFGPNDYAGANLPGGKPGTYRELLLTLPEKTSFDSSKVKIVRHRASSTQGETEVFYDGKSLGRWGDNPTLNDRGEYVQKPESYWRDIAKWQFSNQSYDSGSFVSGHFGAKGYPNVLAHVRFDERTSPNGERILFVQEMQSDWASKGRKEGFSDRPRARRFHVEDGGNNNWHVVDENGTRIITAGSRQYAEERAAEYNADGLPAHIRGRGDGIPRAPYVEDTAKWTTLAARRMVRWAAENGYDQIAWTPGVMQVERWQSALRQKVDEIQYDIYDTDGNRSVGFLKDGRLLPRLEMKVRPDGTIYHIPDISAASEIEGKHLSAVVGKSIAKKILEGPGGSLVGKDLTVGGEGFKSLYDGYIRAAFEKIGKPWGVRVGEAGITQNAGEMVDDGAGGVVRTGDKTKILNVPALDITPEMRQSVMATGMPVYSLSSTPSPEVEEARREAGLPAGVNRTPRQTAEWLLRWVPSGGRNVEEMLTNIPAGQEYMQRVRRAWRGTHHLIAQWNSRLEVAARDLSRADKQYLRESFLRDFETEGASRTWPSPAVAAFAEAWREVNDQIGALAEEYGVRLRTPQGQKGFSRWDPETYVPHRLTDKAREILERKNGADWDALLEAVEANGIDVQVFLHQANIDIRQARFGSMDYSRIAGLPWSIEVDGKQIQILDTNPEILFSHIRGAARRLSTVKEFGLDEVNTKPDESNSQEYINQVAQELVSAGADTKPTVEALARIWSRLQGKDIESARELFGSGYKYFSALEATTAGLNLSTAVIGNLLGGHLPESIRMGMMPTARAFAKSYTTSLKNADLDELRTLVDLEGDILAGMQYTETLEGKAKKGARVILTGTGFIEANRRINLAVAIAMVRVNMKAMLDAIRENRSGTFEKFWGKDAGWARRYLTEELKFSEEDVDRMVTDGPTEEDLSRAIGEQLELVNAMNEGPGSRPKYVAQPLFRLFWAYSTYARKMYQTTWYAGKEATKGNWRPLTTLLFAGTITGELIRAVRDALWDRDREDQSKLVRFLEDMAQVATFGMLSGFQYVLTKWDDKPLRDDSWKDVVNVPVISTPWIISRGLVNSVSQSIEDRKFELRPAWKGLCRVASLANLVDRQVVKRELLGKREEPLYDKDGNFVTTTTLRDREYADRLVGQVYLEDHKFVDKETGEVLREYEALESNPKKPKPTESQRLVKTLRDYHTDEEILAIIRDAKDRREGTR